MKRTMLITLSLLILLLSACSTAESSSTPVETASQSVEPTPTPTPTTLVEETPTPTPTPTSTPTPTPTPTPIPTPTPTPEPTIEPTPDAVAPVETATPLSNEEIIALYDEMFDFTTTNELKVSVTSYFSLEELIEYSQYVFTGVVASAESITIEEPSNTYVSYTIEDVVYYRQGEREFDPMKVNSGGGVVDGQLRFMEQVIPLTVGQEYLFFGSDNPYNKSDGLPIEKLYQGIFKLEDGLVVPFNGKNNLEESAIGKDVASILE